MKEVWLHLPEWRKELVTTAIESGIDVVFTVPELTEKVRDLGRISIAASCNGDIKVPEEVEVVVIRNKDDENMAAKMLSQKRVIVRTTDWDIIPIENLIPNGADRILTFVRNLDDAKLAAGIMEKGVSGVVIETDDPQEVSRVIKYIRENDQERLNLQRLEITRIKSIGIGDRVCVDTCSNLALGEGLLVGNSSQGLFLVHAENLDNPYVDPRPFRVNAGSVHSYVRIPGARTRYLGELGTGDGVLIVRHDGTTYTAFVGRSKIEKRPMLVVFAKGSDGIEHSVVLQNAETIRLTNAAGEAVSIVSLRQGDIVLGLTESWGRHFGMAVDETIKEK